MPDPMVRKMDQASLRIYEGRSFTVVCRPHGKNLLNCKSLHTYVCPVWCEALWGLIA